VNRECQ